MMMMIIVEFINKLIETFKALSKDDILQPYMSEEDFRTSKVRVADVSYNLYVFVIRYQKNLQFLNRLK